MLTNLNSNNSEKSENLFDVGKKDYSFIFPINSFFKHIISQKAGEFIHTTGDTHLYLNHLEQAKLQLTRTPRPLPIMKLNPDVKDIFSFKYEDFQLEGYDPWPHIKAEVSV